MSPLANSFVVIGPGRSLQDVTDPEPPAAVTPDRRRSGIKGSSERLNRQYPLASPAPADGEPGRGAVRVRLTGHSDDLAKLLPTLPGLNITRVASAAELVDGEY